jgi:phosphodiesterase/alkaline phosphatase D-like protein
MNGNRTYFDKDPAQEEVVLLASDDGITWTRMRPTSVTGPNLVAPTVTTPNTVVSTEATPTPTVAAATTVASPVSSLGLAFHLNRRAYNLNLPAKAGAVYQLQASTDLEHWVTLTTMTNNGEGFGFLDQDVEKYPRRFYRLKLQP